MARRAAPRGSGSAIGNPKSAIRHEGWRGWDAYAPFYDWENARTLGRRDVAFWTSFARQASGRVLELGCGTGRVSIPVAKAGVDLVGIDRSAPMLERAVSAARGLRLVRGDIRVLPFPAASFSSVIAPYGILQSLTNRGDLSDALASVARVLAPGGRFGIDLVPDVPNWREYRDRVQMTGRQGRAHLTLIESVRQDRKRQLTTFEQRYVERIGGREQEHRFELTFRTLTVPQMSRQLARAGFTIDAVLGDYRGRPWDARADVWIILARRK